LGELAKLAHPPPAPRFGKLNVGKGAPLFNQPIGKAVFPPPGGVHGYHGGWDSLKLFTGRPMRPPRPAIGPKLEFVKAGQEIGFNGRRPAGGFNKMSGPSGNQPQGQQHWPAIKRASFRWKVPLRSLTKWEPSDFCLNESC